VSAYCDIAPGHPIHASYHDTEYGFPLRSDDGLLERFALEINQAGLSWELMLRKRDGFRRAFADFDLETVAGFGMEDTARLLADPGIIRNRLKIAAVIENARRMLRLRDTHGSFATWLDAHQPSTREQWLRLFKKTFVFTGGEIVGELLMSTGYLPGAHRADCPAQPHVLRAGPAWMRHPNFAY
jgi:DNA-3-methyladenine glycosylase I